MTSAFLRWARRFLQWPPKVDPEIYIGRGQQRLNDGVIALAADDLFTAIDIVQNHGIALGLAAIAAMRADDSVRQKQVVDRFRSASKQLLFDLGEVGKWYSRPAESGVETSPQLEKNRVAFNAFVGTLAPLLEDDRERLFWLGEGLHAAQLAGVSTEVLSRYCRIYPGRQDAEAMLINSTILMCDFDNSERFWKNELVKIEHQFNSGEHINIDPFNLLLTGVEFDFFSRVCRQRSMGFIPDGVSKTSGTNKAVRSGERIRIGFLLPYSWFASCNVIVHALLPEFDQNRFEVYGYALHTNTAQRADDFEREFRARFDRFVALDDLDAEGAARLIEADRIDVALDVSGHNRTTCLPILAYRPASLQAHYLGWATIIEAPYIDYLITDPYYHPKHLRDLTTETYALMPDGSWIYPPVGVVDGERDCTSEASPFRFCSFNHLGKIDSETFAAWLEILRGTDHSVLVLCHWNLGDAVRNMRSNAERAGIDPARLVFLPMVDHAEHLRRLRSMDLALDTLRLGGGVTTLDAIWVGLPVVAACTDESYLCACRGAFGPLSMSKEIVTDVSSYVSRAIELRNNESSLAALREKIAARRRGVMMFDPHRYTAELQRLIQEMWARHTRGERPTTFKLS